MIVQSPHFKKQFDISKAQLIGQGNFAQVYKIFDIENQSNLAIRRVDRDLGQSQDIEKQKTINEQLRKVQNQHILKIFDIIESEKCVWYITQYCEGGSLWDALNNCQDNKMNQKDALQVIYQVSKGVKQLHNHRITHRDLKPQNILLSSKYLPNKPIPIIKIADFGLSTKKIIMETIAGTKQYIAPQQARFHNYTNAVDVWSLGIIFDEILHGSPFYVGDNNKEVFQKILKNPYKVRDQTIRPSIQEFLISVLKKKAYERPIIAVICQNIEKILQQIKKQRKQDKSTQKPRIFQKKVMKSLASIPTQPKQETPVIPATINEEIKQKQKQLVVQIPVNKIVQEHESKTATVKPALRNEQRQKEREREKDKDKDRSQTKAEQRRAKTPFKRQNGRPQLLRPLNDDSSSQFSNSVTSLQKIRGEATTPTPNVGRKQLQNSVVSNVSKQTNKQSRQPFRDPIKQINKQLIPKQIVRDIQKQSIVREKPKQISKQKPTVTQTSQKSEPISQNDKINIYRVDNKKKIQSLPSKTPQQTPNIIDVKQYMQSLIKLKSDLSQSTITIAKQRQFIPNAQLTINEFPQKYDGEEVLRKYKKNYQYLNFVAYKPDYEIKVYTGKNVLVEQTSKAEKELLEHKDKIRKCFLGQIDKFVDYYIQKTLK